MRVVHSGLIMLFQGRGAIAVNYLVVATATAEISRGQLWQWLRRSVILDNGQTFTESMYQEIRKEEMQRLGGPGEARLQQAAEILDHLVLSKEMEEFLTLPAYTLLENPQARLQWDDECKVSRRDEADVF